MIVPFQGDLPQKEKAKMQETPFKASAIGQFEKTPLVLTHPDCFKLQQSIMNRGLTLYYAAHYGKFEKTPY